MRTTTKRKLAILGLIAAIVAAIVSVNSFSERRKNRVESVDWRRIVETRRLEQGADLLSWEVVRKTIGTMRTGPAFDTEFAALESRTVIVVGFMEPLYKINDAPELLLLPMPVRCYFLGMPPVTETIFVQLAAGELTTVTHEPVVIRGTLKLNRGPGTKFFYVMKNARWGFGTDAPPGRAASKETPGSAHNHDHDHDVDTASPQ